MHGSVIVDEEEDGVQTIGVEDGDAFLCTASKTRLGPKC